MDIQNSCIFEVSNKNRENMTTTNTQMTIEEARKVLASKNGFYATSEHNKKMIANAMREIIAQLHGEAPKYI